MRKNTIISLIVFILTFCCMVTGMYAQDEQPITEGASEIPQEQLFTETGQENSQENPDAQGTDDQLWQEEQNPDGQIIGETFSQNEQETGQPEAGEQTTEGSQNQDPVSGNEQETVPEPIAVPEWQDIDEDQLTALQMVWNEMTEAGRAFSGWFCEGDYSPCNWQGIRCENRQITGLVFQNAGYFRTFPQSVLSLKGLKNLVFVDTLMKGPLPDTLFDELPNLEELEIKGNYLTGSIPDFPGVYTPLRELTISDNLEDDRKVQLSWLPEYSETVSYQLSEFDYPEIDLQPGLDGTIPESWWQFGSLTKLDLSDNQLSGAVPDGLSQLPLSELNLSGNAEDFSISEGLYQAFFEASQYNPAISLDGIQTPAPVSVPDEIPETTDGPEGEVDENAYPPADNNSADQQDQNDFLQPVPGEGEPEGAPGDLQLPVSLESYPDPALQQEQSTEEPYVAPTEVPYVAPTEVPYVAPTDVPYVAPTEVPYVAPTDVPYIAPTEVPYVAPTEVPYVAPTDVPYVAPTEVPYVAPTDVPYIAPTEVPYVAPTDVPYVPPTNVPVQPTQAVPTAQTIIIVVTATPVPQQWYTATPPNYNYNPQPYYYPTATPYYQQPYYIYPTATPYTYYNPNWVYPTATSSYSYSYPDYGQNQSPTQAPSAVPMQDIPSQLGFTYKMEAMTENNIPMTWRYTGMQDYSIVYLDSSGNLYPAFGMEWKPASEVCNSSVCNASVSAPDELLRQGKFSLQLQTRDASGRIYQSDPVTMEVSLPAMPEPTPVPEQPKSVFVGFLEWLFGPIIRLFGGGK